MITERPMSDQQWPTGFRVVETVNTGHQIRMHNRHNMCAVMCRCSDRVLSLQEYGFDVWGPFNRHLEEIARADDTH